MFLIGSNVNQNKVKQNFESLRNERISDYRITIYRSNEVSFINDEIQIFSHSRSWKIHHCHTCIQDIFNRNAPGRKNGVLARNPDLHKETKSRKMLTTWVNTIMVVLWVY